MHGRCNGERATHAVAHHADLATSARKVIHGSPDVLMCGVGEIEAVHHVAGFIGILRHSAFVQVRRQCVVACRRKAVGDTLDLGVETPPLLNHNDAGFVLAGKAK